MVAKGRAAWNNLRRSFRAAVRTASGVDPSSDPDRWLAWNDAVQNATALAEDGARWQAVTFADLGIKLEVLCWYFDQHDVFLDQEAERQFRNFAINLRHLIRALRHDPSTDT